MAEPRALMLFAAGFGTRMGALTHDRPKPLVKVGGITLLDHALALADEARAKPMVVNLHYRGDQIRDHLKTRPEIAFSDETETILETGGGLRAALPLLGEGPVFTLNTDAVWTGANALTELRSAWDPERMDALLLLVPRAHALGHAGKGDFDMASDGRLRRGTDLVYAGAQVVRPDGLALIPDRAFSLNRLWDLCQQQGRLFGTIHSGGWCDVGRPESISLAEAMLKADGNV